MAWPNFHLKNKLHCVKNELWGGNNGRKAAPGSSRHRREAQRSRVVRLRGVQGRTTGLANRPGDVMRTGPATGHWACQQERSGTQWERLGQGKSQGFALGTARMKWVLNTQVCGLFVNETVEERMHLDIQFGIPSMCG